jgi:hypothetical protein
MLRKQIFTDTARPDTSRPDIKDIPALATVLMTSETPDHPVDNVFDRRGGPGGTRWVAGTDGEQTLVVAFDQPQAIHRIGVEIEELASSRTQVLSLALSQDGGRTYREHVRQEFNFSPPGTTFEREDWAVPAEHVTHVRLVILPDKGHAPARATLTSLTIR